MDTALTKLHHSPAQFLYPLTLDQTYKRILSQVVAISGAKHGTIFLRRRNSFTRAYTTLPPTSRPEPSKFGRAYQVYLSGKPTQFVANKKHLAHGIGLIKVDLEACGRFA